eukprot:9674523-Alexandrium_andersonii.AAC.1
MHGGELGRCHSFPPQAVRLVGVPRWSSGGPRTDPGPARVAARGPVLEVARMFGPARVQHALACARVLACA